MKKFIILLVAAALCFVAGESQASHKRRCHPPRTYYCPPCACRTLETLPLAPTPAVRALRTIQLKSGRLLTLFDSGDNGDYEDVEERRTLPLTGAIDEFNDYVGSDRKAAKLSFVESDPKVFTTVSDLVHFVTTGDRTEEKMKLLHIARDEHSDRVAVEKVKVTVVGFIYAFKKEDNDNDYHVILGDPPGTPNRRFFNVEVSALPAGGHSRQVLRGVRQTFKDHYQLPDDDPPISNYITHAPVRVRVTGSLFFDVIHITKKVGPAAFKPKSAWEIHPVTELKFLDEPQ